MNSTPWLTCRDVKCLGFVSPYQMLMGLSLPCNQSMYIRTTQTITWICIAFVIRNQWQFKVGCSIHFLIVMLDKLIILKILFCYFSNAHSARLSRISILSKNNHKKKRWHNLLFVQMFCKADCILYLVITFSLLLSRRVKCLKIRPRVYKRGN